MVLSSSGYLVISVTVFVVLFIMFILAVFELVAQLLELLRIKQIFDLKHGLDFQNLQLPFQSGNGLDRLLN